MQDVRHVVLNGNTTPSYCIPARDAAVRDETFHLFVASMTREAGSHPPHPPTLGLTMLVEIHFAHGALSASAIEDVLQLVEVDSASFHIISAPLQHFHTHT